MLTIETERLQMIPLSLQLMRAALYDPEQIPALSGAHAAMDWPGDIAGIFPSLIEAMERDPLRVPWDGVIIHKADRLIIGDMGLKGGPNALGIADVGYSIVPAYRSQGYASEMLRGLLNWAFVQQRLHAITASCLTDNIASIKVLEKVGMQRFKENETLISWIIHRTE